MGMPKVLEDFLKQLPDTEAELVWEYLDETPHVACEMVEVVYDSHKELTVKLCGPNPADTWAVK